MENSADPNQLASSDLHCLQRQGISGHSRTRVNRVLFLDCILKQFIFDLLSFQSRGKEETGG